ncbi:hypothetical protein [Streptomyces griseorubiginosus]|uniref:hypothetical protein n=1 Tax=Streptomyces griseorubiginosus TaxID=67304 RepID=UPI001AD698A1|nr:hypothetical protein [Streptomyces griseorubiginosus]MBO4259380.1 hypothetical protein [Streptomyces griseorubiginosus]
MTVGWRGAPATGLVPAGFAFPVGGSLGGVRRTGVARWAGVEVRFGVLATSAADWEKARR